ncbi:MAG: DUF177 domain-containing protein [Selenomonas sp.]|uniref:YceD family protein n=1 Tax=Selenomonas sp. TaxID=2053611 RepID=UPI0025F4414C|nr:DUF177 domain-containing protein [Selenomonas sp.]MCI6100003.1 DUF177 domain-containing protein [Selenomonas sp.]MCI6233360.1 DUF177 domain-containing protein [Selenomonas sp.]
MHIHIAELNDGLGKNLPFSFTTAAAQIDATADDYAFEGPIEVTGTVTNTGAGYRVEGVIRATKHFVCNRCLDECTEAQEHAFCETFRRGAFADDEDVNLFEGDTIELDELVRDTLLAAQPLSNICKPDCKGLCPVCGANLNHGDCGCDTFVPDPRLAALQDFMTKDND